MFSEVCREDNPLAISRHPFGDLLDTVIGAYGDSESFARHGDWEHCHALMREWQKSADWLTLEAFVGVARPGADGRYRRVEIDSGVLAGVEESRKEVNGYLADGKLIYGVTTGYGANRKHFFQDLESARRLSANILYSHAAGVGRPLPADVVRGMMLLRLWTFAQGHSGISSEILSRLKQLLNRGVVPYVPEKGSVGCSGDLCSLAHLFLVLIGEGQAWVIRDWEDSAWRDGKDRREWWLRDGDRAQLWNQNPYVLLEGREALALTWIDPLEPGDLQAKDGLAMTNGAAQSAAALALAAFDAEVLYKTANISASLTHQAVVGHTRVFEPQVGAVRPHPGQILATWEMVHLLQGSTLKNRCALVGESQDDYCIRCVGPVHGSACDAIAYARRVAEIEINSATDNPLFFKNLQGFQFKYAEELPDHDLVRRSLADTHHCSAANFNGEPVALALDLLKIALSELASISERRIQLLLDGNRSRGLPENLALGKPGLQTGFMLAQYTAAALVSENKVLCHPSSVDSIPTSADAEDHVSMAANAARHARQVVENVSDTLAIEVLCALQALEIRTTEMGPWVRVQMKADRETIQQVRSALALDVDGELDANDVRHLRCFIEKRFAENAILLFPNCGGEANAESAGELLDTSQLSISPRARKVRDLVRRSRRHGGLEIPLILSDGFPAAPGQTFRERPIGELIESIAVAIRERKIVDAAWSVTQS